MMFESHLKCWKKINNVEIFSVCDTVEKKAREASEKVKSRKWYTDYKEALQDPVDIVDIILPHHLHREVVVDACKEKKHVICEKPMAMTVNDAEAMCVAAEDNKVLFGVRTQMRLQSTLLKELISAGEIGKPYLGLIELGSFTENSFLKEKWPPWSWMKRREYGGGVLAGPGPHRIDLLIWLIGSAVKEVFAAGTQIALLQDFDAKDVNVEDTAICGITFKSGAIGHVLATWKLKQIIRPLTIAGTDGVLIHEKKDKIILDKRNGNIKEYKISPSNETMESLFVKSVENNVPYISPGREQIEVAKVLEKASQSMKF